MSDRSSLDFLNNLREQNNLSPENEPEVMDIEQAVTEPNGLRHRIRSLRLNGNSMRNMEEVICRRCRLMRRSNYNPFIRNLIIRNPSHNRMPPVNIEERPMIVEPLEPSRRTQRSDNYPLNQRPRQNIQVNPDRNSMRTVSARPGVSACNHSCQARQNIARRNALLRQNGFPLNRTIYERVMDRVLETYHDHTYQQRRVQNMQAESDLMRTGGA